MNKHVMIRVLLVLGLSACATTLWAIGWDDLVNSAEFIYRRTSGGRTQAEAIEHYGPAARERLRPAFLALHLAYPPPEATLLVDKTLRRLTLFVPGESSGPVEVLHYPVLGASGKLGPKLREGDRQVPEGVYRINSLNPNSRFHLSLALSYPNAFDREQARVERRSGLGGDIMIHGGTASVGCVAIGNQAIEELFVLVHEVGPTRVKVVIVPQDLITLGTPSLRNLPTWCGELYQKLRQEMELLRPAGK